MICSYLAKSKQESRVYSFTCSNKAVADRLNRKFGAGNWEIVRSNMVVSSEIPEPCPHCSTYHQWGNCHC